ncbi:MULTISPECIES: cation:proton antiporter [Haloferax]|uniref:Na(+)/H(+) antiporter NhaG n=1 Tax=Haloferax massiliensis TaxID=1476858 RepID=A0A0D6JV39_9EURY|nr:MULTISPECIES: sodium:proton antiporter [Haloferax]MDS0241431.1 sodium:proton antiporter [Haloferax sp. S2CR25]MDS0444552.1 sodium:proton antiporter [Haloferax sp. S2CR25-2]CQR52114.1 Na(+)/H(+) antiporter NhaG [Haloferax massiliensis]
MAGVEEQLLTLLYLFGVAAVAGLLTVRYTRLQYTTGLLLAGLLISVLGSPVEVALTSDLILLALLPALIFNDAIEIDVEAFRENLVPILVLAVVGLLFSIALIAAIGQFAFGFSLAVAILFGAIIMPTDPVSVLAIFEDLGVPERLNILVEGESLLNDGVSIVVYSSVLAVFVEARSRGLTVREFATIGAFITDVGLGIVVALVGGALVGAAAGYVGYALVSRVDDELIAVVLSFLVAYGVFILLDILGSSGVIGTLTAGVVLASRLSRTAVSPETSYTVGAVWEYAAFIANTLVFVALGVITPFDLLLEYGVQIAAAIVFVFLARAVVVYPLVELLNRRSSPAIPRGYQHVLVWSGIHASVSIALVLGFAEAFPGPLAEQLSALVFGVAAFTLLVNGPTMGAVISRVGISGQRPSQRLYEALIGRLHGVDAALDTAERLLEQDRIPTSVFDDLTATYKRERLELEAAIESLLARYPDIREHEERLGRHRILIAEFEAIRGAIKRGEISQEVGDRLLRDVEADIDHALSDEGTVPGPRPGRDPYWRHQLEQVGLDAERADDATIGEGTEGP